MFGIKKENTNTTDRTPIPAELVDHELLAQHIFRLQKEHEKKLHEEKQTLVGVYDSAEDLKKLTDLADEEVGLERTLSDILRMRARIAYERSAIWDTIYEKLNLDPSPNYRIDTKTGEVRQLTHGYDEILRTLEISEIRKESQ